MTAAQSALLGVIQGLTEFLPVSSSGHLVLAQKFFGFREVHVLVDALLHMGTLLAVLVYFRSDIKAILLGPDRRLAGLLVLGSLPAAIVGLTLKHYIEAAFTSVPIVSAMLLLTGAVLALGDWKSRRPLKRRGLQEARAMDAVGVGLAQAAAIMPGLSRSGSTIVAGIWLNLEPEAAARFSFLLAVPAVLGASALELVSSGAGARPPVSVMAVGMASAFVVGMLAIATLLKVLREGRLRAFSYYCFALGTISLLAYYLL